MAEKVYVKDYLVKNSDGDYLQVCKVYTNKPKSYKYIVFVKERK